jgi:hypothetical protein
MLRCLSAVLYHVLPLCCNLSPGLLDMLAVPTAELRSASACVTALRSINVKEHRRSCDCSRVQTGTCANICLDPFSWRLRLQRHQLQLERTGRRRSGTVLTGCLSQRYVHAWIIIIMSSRDNSVCATTCYWLNGSGSVSGRERFFSSLDRPHRLWGPPSLVPDGHRDFSRIKWRGLKLTMYINLLLKSIIVELYLHCPWFHATKLS